MKKHWAVPIAVLLAMISVGWVVAAQGQHQAAAWSFSSTTANLLVPTTVQQPISISIAPVDVVLLLDASEALAYDAPSQEAYSGDASKGCIASDLTDSTLVNACAKACNDNNSCHPFLEQKNAAKDFIDQLRYPYDRIAVVSFQREINLVMPLTTNLTAAKDAIDAMRMHDHSPGYAAGTPCPTMNLGGQRWKCTSSNIGGAIRTAAQVLTSSVSPSNSLQVVILIGSGGANATDPIPSADPDSASWGFCPGNPQGTANKDNPPNCRDNSFATHHLSTSAQYDAEDYAYDWINSLANPQPQGLGISIFTLGFGKGLVCITGQYDANTGACLANSWLPAWQDQNSGLPNGAELFLRYAAAIGDDGNPNSDPCAAITSGVNCGNYYFARNTSPLIADLLDIASRILSTMPVANFTAAPRSGIVPLTVTFTNLSAGDYANSTWDFGDSITSSLPNPIHVYWLTGTYTVTLQVSGLGGRSEIARPEYISVYSPPYKFYLPLIMK